jgi:cellulose synthase/poly-beta-1,6-N-acetylglucosamine synthase-like glycosyltransferase
MNQTELFDADIRALQQWLREAWQQLGDPSLTAFTRRELRNQMKQCNAELRAYLQKTVRQRFEPHREPIPSFTRPRLRILAG